MDYLTLTFGTCTLLVGWWRLVACDSRASLMGVLALMVCCTVEKKRREAVAVDSLPHAVDINSMRQAEMMTNGVWR